MGQQPLQTHFRLPSIATTPPGKGKTLFKSPKLIYKYVFSKVTTNSFQTFWGVNELAPKHTSLHFLLSPFSLPTQTTPDLIYKQYRSVTLSYHRFIQKLLNLHRCDDTMVYYKAWQVVCHFTSTLWKRKKKQITLPHSAMKMDNEDATHESLELKFSTIIINGRK